MIVNGGIPARSAELRKNMTLENLFRLTCDYGERVAARYLDGEKEISITYSEYEKMARDYAVYFRGVVGEENKGKFVAIQMDTSWRWFPTFWGLCMAGYDAVLLDFTLNDEMTGYLLSQSGAVALITAKPRNIDVYVKQIMVKDLDTIGHTDASFVPSYANHVALCTSGTTATSRIFVYDGNAVVHQVLNSELLYDANKQIICDEPRRALAFLPYHHVFGFMVELMWIQFLGYENIYLKDRSPQTILSTARRFHVTHLMAVPLLANNITVGLNKKVANEKPMKRFAFKSGCAISLALQTISPKKGMDYARTKLFKSINEQLLGTDICCIILGGSHTPKEHMRMLSALGYYTVSGFGMTETAITSVESSMNLHTRTSGSVGMPLKSAQYRVESTGEDKTRGEMYIKGESLHTGRLVDGKIVPPDFNQDGWFRTGDVVRLESGNRMFVEGRCKDVIINESGENVYPDEIEEMFAVLPGVEQVCVLGTALRSNDNKKKNEIAYEDITLVVNVGAQMGDAAYMETLASSAAQINAKLPVMKKVTRALVTGQKFEAVNGIKIKRVALKKLIEENKLPCSELDLKKRTAVQTSVPTASGAKTESKEASSVQLNDIKNKVRHIYAETLSVADNAVDDNAHFIDDLGGDSLQVLGMSLKVEEMFNVLIPTEEYGKCTTVNGLAQLILDKMNGVSVEKKDEDVNVVPITRFEDTPEYKAFAEREKNLMKDGDNPYFVCHESPLTDKSMMDGHEVLNFGSYNYVGMSGRKEVEEAAKAAIDKYGTSASGSRLLAGEKKLYQELEKELADWKHAEDALVLVGGHSTNVTIVGNFCGKGDLILYDAIAHNSIEEGCRLSDAMSKPFPHSDVKALESILKTQRHKFAKVLIVIEGAYSMDGDIAPVPEIVQLKKKYGCFLMVDEAHSACVIGKTGGGVDEYFGLKSDDIDIKMGTLSKGLGACGGYLAGKRTLIEYLRYSLPGFVFSVGISPALAAATLESIRLLRSDPSIMERMRRNISVFMTEAKKHHYNTCLAGETAICPVMVGKDEDAFLLSNIMRKKGVFVPPAVYPAVPKNKARLRFCVISEHQPEQIVFALNALEDAAKEAGIALPRV